MQRPCGLEAHPRDRLSRPKVYSVFKITNPSFTTKPPHTMSSHPKYAYNAEVCDGWSTDVNLGLTKRAKISTHRMCYIGATIRWRQKRNGCRDFQCMMDLRINLSPLISQTECNFLAPPTTEPGQNTNSTFEKTFFFQMRYTFWYFISVANLFLLN